jgi:protein-disulfide isomerase
MAHMIRRLFATLLFLLSTGPAPAQPLVAQFPLKGADGTPIANHALSAAQMASVAALPGLVNVGNTNGNVTLYEFYDLNCPFCRRAAADVDTLIRSDPALAMILVPYPVLSRQSIEGARVELALREIAPPKTFLEFHRRIYAGRGVIDGRRALNVAKDMGIDLRKLIEAANTPRVTDTMRTHAQLGNDLNLVATPAYVIQGVALVGHPGLESLRKVIGSVRSCKKVVC